MTQSIASILRPVVVPSARRLVLLWLMVALLVQGFAIQIHAHVGVDRTLAIAASSQPATAVTDRRQDGPASPACPLCEEKALFGAYLLGGSVVIAAPADMGYHYTALTLPLMALDASAHAWQSRAPPAFTA